MASNADNVLTARDDAFDFPKLARELSEAVRQVKDIQASVSSLLDSIVVRKTDISEKEKAAIRETLTHVHQIQSKLEKLGSEHCKMPFNQMQAVPLGNTGYVSLDSGEDKSSFYNHLIKCYTWLKNMDTVTTKAFNTMKRSAGEPCYPSAKRQKLSFVNLKEMLEQAKQKFPKLSINDSILTSKSMIEVRLNNVFTACVMFSGNVVSSVVVRSIIEHFVDDDIWKPSKHIVFQRLSVQLQAKILELHAEDPLELLLMFLQHMSLYDDLFTAKCAFCNLQLQRESQQNQFLPPLTRGEGAKDIFHLSCK